MTAEVETDATERSLASQKGGLEHEGRREKESPVLDASGRHTDPDTGPLWNVSTR